MHINSISFVKLVNVTCAAKQKAGSPLMLNGKSVAFLFESFSHHNQPFSFCRSKCPPTDVPTSRALRVNVKKRRESGNICS